MVTLCSAYIPDVRTHIIIKLPFIYKKTGFNRNKKGLYLDERKIYKYFSITQDSARRLARAFNEGNFKQKKYLFRLRISKYKLAKNYKQLIDEGEFKNQAELARGLGVSRAWVTKVMNILKKKN